MTGQARVFPPGCDLPGCVAHYTAHPAAGCTCPAWFDSGGYHLISVSDACPAHVLVTASGPAMLPARLHRHPDSQPARDLPRRVEASCFAPASEGVSAGDALREERDAWREHALADCAALRRVWQLADELDGRADAELLDGWVGREIREAVTGSESGEPGD